MPTVQRNIHLQQWISSQHHRGDHFQLLNDGSKVTHLLQHLLSGGQFLPMFLQRTFKVSDLLSLCFDLVSQDAHLKEGTFIPYNKADLSRYRNKRVKL